MKIIKCNKITELEVKVNFYTKENEGVKIKWKKSGARFRGNKRGEIVYRNNLLYKTLR